MIHIVDSHNIADFASEMQQAYKLRHQVFVEEMGWDYLRKENGLEVDQFDNDDAVHMLYIDNGRVVGYQRMLPTTGPHLLSTVMPELCEGPSPAGTNIWEWTRYAVAKEHRERGRKLSPIANALLTAIVEWGLKRDIDTIIIEMDPLWLLRLVQLHFRITPLGFPIPMSGKDVIAVTAGFNKQTLSRLKSLQEDAADGSREATA